MIRFHFVTIWENLVYRPEKNNVIMTGSKNSFLRKMRKFLLLGSLRIKLVLIILKDLSLH